MATVYWFLKIRYIHAAAFSLSKDEFLKVVVDQAQSGTLISTRCFMITELYELTWRRCPSQSGYAAVQIITTATAVTKTCFSTYSEALINFMSTEQ